MEEIMNALRGIRNELDEQKVTILKSSERVTDQVTQNINNILEEKFKRLEEKYDVLKEKMENQEKRLYFLEKQVRQRNIVIFGLEETETSYFNLEENIVRFIDKYLSVKLDRRDIQESRRIGKKGDRPRPLTITFSTLGIKIEIIKKRRNLNNTSYYIKEDYPQNIIEKRKKLQEQIEIEKEKGISAIIKYDKIIILNKDLDIKNNKKRTLPISPDHNTGTRIERKEQNSKKNKTQAPLQRSSSLSESILKPSMLDFLTNKKPIGTIQDDKSRNM